jgi:hypothetical protein
MVNTSFSNPCEYGRIEAVFFDFDTLTQPFFIVLFQYGNTALSNDGSRVHTLINHVNGTSCDGYFSSKNITVGMGAREMWQERRVDVDDMSIPSIEEGGREQAHITREDDEFDVEFL